MRGAAGFAALVALGSGSAAVYASAVPVTGWLGVEPLAGHPAIFALAFALYLVALWLVVRRLSLTPGAAAVIVGFGLLFRALVLPTPVYLSSDVYRYLWDGQVQWVGQNPYRVTRRRRPSSARCAIRAVILASTAPGP